MSTYKFEKIIFVFSNLICTYMKGSTNTSFVLIQFCSTNEKLVNSLIQSMKFNYSLLMKYYKNALIIARQQFHVIITTETIISFYSKWSISNDYDTLNVTLFRKSLPTPVILNQNSCNLTQKIWHSLSHDPSLNISIIFRNISFLKKWFSWLPHPYFEKTSPFLKI